MSNSPLPLPVQIFILPSLFQAKREPRVLRNKAMVVRFAARVRNPVRPDASAHRFMPENVKAETLPRISTRPGYIAGGRRVVVFVCRPSLYGGRTSLVIVTFGFLGVTRAEESW